MYKNYGMLQNQLSVRVIVDIVIWFAVAVPVLLLFLYGTPYERGFYCGDTSLSFPYKQESLSTSSLLVAGVILSILVIIVTEVLNCFNIKCYNHYVAKERITYNIKCYAAFLTGFILQQAIEKVVKNRTGVLRPNFFDVCKPDFNTSLCPNYIINYTCTGTNHKEIRDSRLSFPSGHSSLAMYLAVYFCMYIEERLKISFSHVLKLFLQSGLIFIALICGIDRVIDNKHHPSDVIAGFVLGLTVALFVYQKIGKKVLFPKKIPEQTNFMTDRSCDCCTCGANSPELEPQTPSPLLPNEELDSLSQDKDVKKTSQLFLNTHFKARRHFSTPNTPTFTPEGGV